MRFEIPSTLIAELRRLQSTQSYPDEVLQSEGAVVLSLGLGPAMYLTFDGRIIVHPYMENLPPYEVSDSKEAYCAIVVGAKNRKASWLLSLLPSRPRSGLDCAQCETNGWMNFGIKNVDGEPIKIVCVDCGGTGWL